MQNGTATLEDTLEASYKAKYNFTIQFHQSNSGIYPKELIIYIPSDGVTSLLRVKNPSTMQETWVWSLGQEDSLEKGMAPHSSILAWRIPWTEEPGGLQSGSQRVGHKWVTNTFQNLSFAQNLHTDVSSGLIYNLPNLKVTKIFFNRWT